MKAPSSTDLSCPMVLTLTPTGLARVSSEILKATKCFKIFCHFGHFCGTPGLWFSLAGCMRGTPLPVTLHSSYRVPQQNKPHHFGDVSYLENKNKWFMKYSALILRRVQASKLWCIPCLFFPLAEEDPLSLSKKLKEGKTFATSIFSRPKFSIKRPNSATAKTMLTVLSLRVNSI